MADLVTLGSLRLQSKQRADMVNSQFIGDSEWNSYINLGAAELYDLLVDSAEDYYTVPTTITTNGNDDYVELPDDFYKLVGVDYFLNGINQPMDKWMFRDRLYYQNQNLDQIRYRLVGNTIKFIPRPAGQNMTLWYVPVCPAMSDDADTLDGVNGFQDYVTVRAAIMALNKEESDVSVLMAELQMMKSRIENMGKNRDQGIPERVTDMYSYTYLNNFMVGTDFFT